ncbi:MAG: hypothetical protein Q9208_008669 [Pyrenodesmia sp. 3 TL-2023]
MAANCAASSCSKEGNSRCAGCKEVSYCSKACQVSHFPAHKKTCPAFQKYNCFLLHADPQTTALPLNNINGQVKSFHLQEYGSEIGEMKELKRRLGWKSASEVGKFYDHAGADTWYYFVYGQLNGKREGWAQNEVASRACGRALYGDVAIIRSGPAGFDTPETFTKSAMVKALEFYKTHQSSTVFAERERSRMGKTTGLDLSGVTSVDATNWDFSRPFAEHALPISSKHEDTSALAIMHSSIIVMLAISFLAMAAPQAPAPLTKDYGPSGLDIIIFTKPGCTGMAGTLPNAPYHSAPRFSAACLSYSLSKDLARDDYLYFGSSKPFVAAGEKLANADANANAKQGCHDLKTEAFFLTFDKYRG